MTGTRDAGAAWDARYDRRDYFYGTAPADFVMRHAADLPSGSRALCVADGEGRNSVWLAARGLDVTAMDASARGLDKARALAADRGVQVDFRHADIADWDWSARTYDAVLAVYIQFAAPQMRARIFAGLDTALRPGGLLLLHGFAPRQVDYGTGGPPERANMYTLDMLRAAFPDYLPLHMADYDAHVDSGAGHSGLAAMVDFVGVKPGG